jgi:ABC-type sulfate/molybdate transport systems ATPase subunit
VVRGGRTILDVPELLLLPGEVAGVVGPNGSGKSTLLKVLAMVMAADDGQVLLDGTAVPWSVRESAPLTAARRRVTLVFQSPVMLSRPVFDNVAAGLRFRGVAEAEVRRRAAYWLDRLGIGALASRRPGGLSGGEAQRAALARALVLEPDWLLLDEPTANLDFPTRSRLLSDLREILTEIRSGAVMVTHDVHDAPHFADRLLVMRDGRIVQQGAPRSVLARPADIDTAVFLGYENVLPCPPAGPAAGRSGGWLCIRPEKVRATAADPAQTDGADSRREPADRRTWTAATVKRLVPWGPAYRVTVPWPEARDGLLTGTADAAEALAGDLAVGQTAWLGWDVADGVALPS